MIALLKGKTTLIILATILLAGVGYLAHQATNKENKQDINITGGTNKIIQGGERKWFIPFVEIYGQTNTENESEGVLRCGLRLEF